MSHTDALAIEPERLAAFVAGFAPGWPAEEGAPDALVFALWSRLAEAVHFSGEGVKRLGVDALRWMRNPPAGSRLKCRITIMGKEPVGDGKGIVFAQHDLLEEAGRLVFSCLTRSLHRR